MTQSLMFPRSYDLVSAWYTEFKLLQSHHSSFRRLEELIPNEEYISSRARSVALELYSWEPRGEEA